jgi:hypothetical protein
MQNMVKGLETIVHVLSKMLHETFCLHNETFFITKSPCVINFFAHIIALQG